MSNSWGGEINPDDWRPVPNREDRRRVPDPEVPPGVTALHHRCPRCGYEFSHPAWDVAYGYKCPQCGKRST